MPLLGGELLLMAQALLVALLAHLAVIQVGFAHPHVALLKMAPAPMSIVLLRGLVM